MHMYMFIKYRLTAANGMAERGSVKEEEWVEAEIERLLENTNVDDAAEDSQLDLGKRSPNSDCQEVCESWKFVMLAIP